MNVDLKALAGPRDRLMVDGAVDPVTAEVIRGAMETVCFEMAMYVSRTATTPILNQSNERNATILDGKGRLAALSVGIPQFMLTSTLPVRFALDFLGVDEFHQGDVFVANDPYHGGGHLPDYNVFAPVVVDGHLVLIASIQCHHGDTGGRRARRLQRDGHRHLGRGRALARHQGARPRGGAPRRPLRPAGQQPARRVSRRHPGPDRRGQAGGGPPGRSWSSATAST